MRVERLRWENCGAIIKAYNPWQLHIYSLVEVENKKYTVYIVDEDPKNNGGVTLLKRNPLSLRKCKRVCQRDFKRGRKQFLKAARDAD